MKFEIQETKVVTNLRQVEATDISEAQKKYEAGESEIVKIATQTNTTINPFRPKTVAAPQQLKR